MKVVVVGKRTSYRTFVLDRGDKGVGALIKRRDPTVDKMEKNHRAHEKTVKEVTRFFERSRVDWSFSLSGTKPIPARADLVVTIGGDGTLLRASHAVGNNTPLLGINSAPGSSVGFFCAEGDSVESILRAALDQKLRRTVVSRMQVELNDRVVHKRVLNEILFCHSCPAATSRYILETDVRKKIIREEQRSSGLWIGPAAGSTAAQKSAGGNVIPLSSTSLQYVVREPYQYNQKLDLILGLVRDGSSIVVRSKMPDAQVFLDGDRLFFSVEMGDRILCKRSDESLTLLGLSTKKIAPKKSLANR